MCVQVELMEPAELLEQLTPLPSRLPSPVSRT